MTRSLGSASPPRMASIVGVCGVPSRGIEEAEPNDWHPSNVQLALAQAHVLWAKTHAPHLLEEWLR